MTELYEVLSERVAGWRAGGYAHDSYPAISELLLYARHEDGSPRYLREPQIRALETYWYLRLVEGTPRIEDLYERLVARPMDRLKALGLDGPELTEIAVNEGYPGLIERIKTDDDFVRTHRLEGLRETLTLDYASYILALAMGAGKTILIGAIVATEFAMALEYPDADPPFVENALVFAPGKTIIESLRELSRIRFDEVLPPRLHAPFAASLKLTFTRDGEKDIPVTRASRFNLVVTNTEKIAIRAKPVRKNAGFLQLTALEEEAREEANLRLQTLASLPHLGVFSDEAHHTYGQSLSTELKRVRQTVDYLADATNVIAVVNTTGTPYFKRQPLKDVVVWYGLAQGIDDNILKEVANNVFAYDFDDANTDEFVAEIVGDFRVLKTDLPPMRVNRLRREMRRVEATPSDLAFTRPADEAASLTRSVFDLGLSAASRRVLRQTGDALTLEIGVDTVDAYTAATALGAGYRLESWPLLDALRATYGEDAIPAGHLDALAGQLEGQLSGYEETRHDEPAELSVLKPEGFAEVTDSDGTVHRQATISYPADRQRHIWPPERIAENAGGYGFHYVPYNFDSAPESDFFEKVLRDLNMAAEEVRDIYFTGAITDPKKTDLAFEYMGADGRTHRYTPDFAIHTTDDRWLLVEVKMTARRRDPVEGEDGVKAKALRDLEHRNPGRIAHRIVFADEFVNQADLAGIRAWVAAR